MASNKIQEKGILAKLLEKALKILIKRECKSIGKIKIDIIASSIQIIKGVIQKVSIIADQINYKYILIDKIELEADKVKIIFTLKNNELRFKNNLFISFKITLSEKSLKEILSSKDWAWIRSIISKEILNQDKLEDIKITNNKLFFKLIKDKDTTKKEEEKIEINAKNGKLYLENKAYNKFIKIPLEDKVYIKNVCIENNLVVILANSPISF